MKISQGLLSVVLLLLVMPGLLCAQTTLRYAGATTLQRYFMPEAARVFSDQTDVRFTIDGGNTDPGLAAVLGGSIDVAGSGRALTRQEKAAGLVEHFLGWDVLAIVLHQANPVDDLSRQQLQSIFTGEIDNWQTLGGADQPIIVITNPRGSGMRSAVQSLILGKRDYLDLEVISAIVAESDQKVALFPNAMTALSMSMVDEARVKVIKVDGVIPSAETLDDGSYALAKPLYLVTRGQPGGALASFIELATGPQGAEILSRRFVPKSP